MASDLTPERIELLIDGLSDDIAFVWVLIHLGLRPNDGSGDPGPPLVSDVDAAFVVLDELSRAGLVKVGHMEYVDGGPPGRVSPVKHVEDPIHLAKQRVTTACLRGSDWEWACWVVNTPTGDGVAVAAFESR